MLFYKRALLSLIPLCHASFGVLYSNSFDALAKRGIDIPDNDTTESQCSLSCQILSRYFNGQVSFPNETFYDYELSLFWSLQQSETYPACIFRPSSADEVAVAVLVANATHCPFAAKSGGHASFSGASNIAGGITIDFADLNEIAVSSDRSTVSIGPGNTWYDVYTALEPQNLTVMGGRVAAIGVGGLTLGGGISFFSNLHGWACDNVANYEVVIASGDIINANPTSHPDLFWALRGGGNNFGLVTRFDTYAYPQGLMWGGYLIHSALNNASLIHGLVDFGFNGVVVDPNAAMWVAFAYVASYGGYFASTELEYAKPLANGTHPAVFDEFFNIPEPLADTTMTQSLSNITLALNASNPSGLRETYWTASCQLNEELVSDIFEIYVEETNNITNVTGILPAIVLQVITLAQLDHMSRNGGNPLGIESSTSPILLINLNAMWVDASDDDTVMQAQSNIISRSVARSVELGLENDFLYMNYASQYQDVISSYGATNKARLEAVAEKYDPTGVFQRLEPGYFKLNGPPAMPMA